MMRRLLPRTLLGRTVLVLILTVGLTEATTQLVFRHYVVDEFGRSLVRIGSNNLFAIGNALRHLSPQARAAFVAETSEASGYQILPVQGNPAPADATHQPTGRLAALEARLQERLSPEVVVLLEQTRQPQRVWVRLPVPEGDWWVRFERTRFDRAFPLSAALLLALGLVLSIVVAWWSVRRINQPLRVIQRKILLLSQGGTLGDTLQLQGPAELHGLATAVNLVAMELRQAEQERALLLAGISHDLRTPLSRLRLAVEMLKQDSSQEKLDLVMDIEEIDQIIEQFLDFARNPDAAPTQIDDLSEVIRECSGRLSGRDIAVALELEPDLNMPLRRPALDRLINNLLDNARKHAGQGILIRSWRDGERICMAVLDRGPGIPEDQVERLLRPFTRLESARTGPPGAGLGLAIVDRIARSHDGVLQLLARPGGGLQAQVCFPAPGRP